jgi:RNA-binding protein 39
VTPPPPGSRGRSIEEEIERLDRTVGVFNLGSSVRGRDLKQFFELHKVGTVVDARIVRDNMTRGSKGIGYVEFTTLEAVERALELTGKSIEGKSCMVQRTDAEKALLMQQMSDHLIPTKAASSTNVKPALPTKIQVENLHKNLTEEVISKIFEQFGLIKHIEVLRGSDAVSTGVAHVEFQLGEDARRALESINGFELAGATLRVGYVSLTGKSAATSRVQLDRDLDDDDEDGTKNKNVTRADIMARMTRDQPVPTLPPSTVDETTSEPSRNISLRNMFNPAEETETNWDVEIKTDVVEECSRFGRVLHIVVDKQHPSGLIFMKFESLDGAKKALSALHGRWFAKRQIHAAFMSDIAYQARFPETAAL